MAIGAAITMLCFLTAAKSYTLLTGDRTNAAVDVRFAPGFSLQGQPARGRTWRAIELGPAGPGAAPLLRNDSGSPALLAVDAVSGSAIAVDLTDYHVAAVDPSGVVRNLGLLGTDVLRRTSVPLTAAAVDRGILWVAGPSGQIVGVNLATWKHRVVRAGAFRLAATDGHVAALRLASDAPFISIWDDDFRVGSPVPAIYDRQQVTEIALDGRIAADAAGRAFVYAPNRGGFLISYHFDGTPRYARSMVAGIPAPEVRKVNGYFHAIPQPGSARVSALAVSRKLIYVLVISPSGPEAVLDAYDADSGVYAGSWRLPVRPEAVAIAAPYVYCAASDGIHILRLRNDSENTH